MRTPLTELCQGDTGPESPGEQEQAGEGGEASKAGAEVRDGGCGVWGVVVTPRQGGAAGLGCGAGGAVTKATECSLSS